MIRALIRSQMYEKRYPIWLGIKVIRGGCLIYYVSVANGLDVEKLRKLAKSVMVE